MASQCRGRLPTSLNKKTKTKSKRRSDDNEGSAGAKRSKGTPAVQTENAVGDGPRFQEPHHSGRAGAGSGGKPAQLKKIGTVLESQNARSRGPTDIPEGLPKNPLAPPQKLGRTGKCGKAKANVSPPPYSAGSDLHQGNPPLEAAARVPGVPSETRPSALTPIFHQRASEGDGFGFGVPSRQPGHIVPPRTEPDLQVLNNPYGSSLRETLPLHSVNNAVHISSHSQPTNASTNLDPAILVGSLSSLATSDNQLPCDRLLSQETFEVNESDEGSKGGSSLNSEESSSQSNESSDNEDADDRDTLDVEWGATKQRQNTHPGFSQEEGPTNPVRHNSLPPDHEFDYSRDKEDQAAARNLMAENDSQPEHACHSIPDDVLECHHTNNGQPSAPDLEHLLAHNTYNQEVPRSRAARNSKKSKDEGPTPSQLRFYKATWKDCLKDAKRECRAAHALDNPFPSKTCGLDRSITESLVTVVIEWNSRGVALEPGFWPDYKKGMAGVLLPFQLLGNMSTW
ncbi:hypothetical protein PAXINDRAFT_153419 [Paxillus involutus ATCC 200175]|nr:hypothetical protein PAXINDRAFT_153419 [Paxillus involutus ATCC 200175]